MLWFLNAYVFLTKLKKHRFIVRNQMFFIRFDMGDNSVSETLVTFGLNFSRPRCHFESYSNLAIVAFKFFGRYFIKNRTFASKTPLKNV